MHKKTPITAELLRGRVHQLMPFANAQQQRALQAMGRMRDADLLQESQRLHLNLQFNLAEKAMTQGNGKVPSYFSKDLKQHHLHPPTSAYNSWLSMQRWYEDYLSEQT